MQNMWKKIEDEIHFIFTREPLQYVRKPFIDMMKKEVIDYDTLSNVERLNAFVSESHLKKFAKWLVEICGRRRDIIVQA